MKTRHIYQKSHKINILPHNSLPSINNSIIRTSPNASFAKTINNYKFIPKLKIPINTQIYIEKKSKSKRYKPSKAIHLIHKLNLESDIRETFLEEIKKEEKREKINNSKEIIERRLGIKNKENDSEEKKKKEKDIKYINEISIEKLNTKEKEKKIEKNYKQSIKDLKTIEIKLSEIDKKLIDLAEIIEGHKMEINVLDNYGKSLDKRNIANETPVRARPKKKNSVVFREINLEEKTERRMSSRKVPDFETEAKLLVKKYQRDQKEKKIQNEVNSETKKLEILLKEKEDLKDKFNDKKKKISDLKNELINIYHTTLYEGLDFRGDGLARILLNIWNLGVNIDMNFIPTYLDNKAIEYLFKKANQIIEITKMKKLVAEAEQDFMKSLKKWKIETNISLFSNKNLNFFKTKINEGGNNSLLDYYPKTKLFMNNYKKTNESQFEKKDDIKLSEMNIKSWNIPKKIIEKSKKMEKVKYSLEVMKNQIETDEKNEVKRLCKEFLFNDYEKKYKVCIETIIGALYGELHMDDMLNLFNKIKKENKDNLKQIEIYYPLSERKKK